LVNADAIYNTVGLLSDWWDTAPPSQKIQDIASIPGNVLSGIGNQVKSEMENPTVAGMFGLSLGVTGGGLLSSSLTKIPADAVGMAIKSRGFGRLGPKYTTDNWRETVATMKRSRSGEVLGALEHPALGKIDVVWGRPGNWWGFLRRVEAFQRPLPSTENQ